MARRPIRIGNASGVIGDGIDQVHRLASSGAVDAITADYLAEFNIALRAAELRARPDRGYEPGFLEQLAWAGGAGARAVGASGVKVVHNGGAQNPRALAAEVDAYFGSLGLRGVKVAWVEGDNVTDEVREGRLTGLRHLDHDGVLFNGGGGGGSSSAETNPILAANIYTGQRGIVKALEEGADIVICGRCCDASPVMGLATWWHSWSPPPSSSSSTPNHYLDALAGSLVAGHLIECSAYITGGNFCGQREVPDLDDIGYPVAEVAADGTAVITKCEGTGGAVTVDTCTAQLLYEIQGERYLNPDVTALLSGAHVETLSDSGGGNRRTPNRVRLSGVVGLPPPETVKVSVCLHGGYQAELSAYATGLDVNYKFNLLRDQLTKRIARAQAEEEGQQQQQRQQQQRGDGGGIGGFSTFSVEKYGSCPPDPRTQREGTVHFRIFAQGPSKDAFRRFRQAVSFVGMQTFCGFHVGMDWRTAAPRPYVKYFPALMPQDAAPDMSVHFVSGERYAVAPPPSLTGAGTQPPVARQRAPTPPPTSSSSSVPASLPEPTTLLQPGDTVKRPLGDLLFARSGDKGGNSNVGFWSPTPSAYPWARSFLTVPRLVQLLGDDWDDRYAVERCEFPHLRAVHFVIKGLLQDGVCSSNVLDGFGKSVGEFLRARLVDMPSELVQLEDRRRQEAMALAARQLSQL